MLILHHPSVRSVVGGDPHGGWLPSGASEPLPEAHTPGLLELRVSRVEAGVELSWAPHLPEHMPLHSGRGSRMYPALEAALSDAEKIFGVTEGSWLFDTRRGPLDSATVDALVSAVLGAWGEKNADGIDEFRRVRPPTLMDVSLSSGEPMSVWSVFVDSGQSHLLFYEPELGYWGVADRSNPQGDAVVIAEYPSLWLTFQWW